MKTFLIVIACAAELVLCAFAYAENAPADLIFLHGRIHTEDAKRSVAQALDGADDRQFGHVAPWGQARSYGRGAAWMSSLGFPSR